MDGQTGCLLDGWVPAFQLCGNQLLWVDCSVSLLEGVRGQPLSALGTFTGLLLGAQLPLSMGPCGVNS